MIGNFVGFNFSWMLWVFLSTKNCMHINYTSQNIKSSKLPKPQKFKPLKIITCTVCKYLSKIRTHAQQINQKQILHTSTLFGCFQPLQHTILSSVNYKHMRANKSCIVTEVNLNLRYYNTECL